MKQIKGYPKYLITPDGKVFSLFSMKYLKPHLVGTGYYQVELFNDKGGKHFLIHRLVAELYLDNKENKRTVNHIDSNKLNNNLLNLEWATYKENQIHAWENGLYKNLSNAWDTTSKLVLDYNTGIYYKNAKEAATARGINYSTLRYNLNPNYKNNTSLKYI